APTVTRGVAPGGGGSGPSPATGTAPAGVAPAGTAPAAAPALAAVGIASAGGAQQVIRHGPGVPGSAAGQAVPTAEQVWQAGAPAAGPRGRRARLIASTALSVALLIASGVVIFLRLHHEPFGVTGVAITGQVRNGCTVDVTGRISTTGGAGTVSYQWIFSSQAAAPQPMSQSAAAGQSAVYVTAAIQGQGHGSVTQHVTLQVLGPGHGTASIPVTVSC
ncbi:MAG TPA: hypothetical protein VF838_17095, partial [Trebonia sp.]